MRENYMHDVQKKEIIIQEQQRDIAFYRELLASNGISFENELQNRSMAMPIKRDPNSLSPSNYSPASTAYQSLPRGPSSAAPYSPQQAAGFINGGGLAASTHSPGMTQHSGSPAGPEVQEVVIKQETPTAVPDMPGIFERQPQLGFDFILQ